MLLLRNTLNAHLTLAAPGQDASAEDAVVFLDGDKTDPISFKIGAVTMLLINVEQEPILRAAAVSGRRQRSASGIGHVTACPRLVS